MMSESFSRHNVYLVCFLLFPVLYFLSLPISVGDLAVWIAHGNYILQHHEILRHDIFSVLQTKEMIYSSGSALLYGIVYQWGGLGSVALLHKLALFVIALVWYRNSLGKLAHPWSIRNGLFILLTWVGCSLLCIDRQALLAILPFVFSYLILQKEEDLSKRDLFWLSFLNVLWVNTHGSWLILGLMYIWREFGRIAFLKRKISFKTFMGLSSIALTSLINPFGYKVIPYVLETIQVSKQRGISEWGNLNPAENVLQFAAFSILVLIFISLYFQLRQKNKFRSSILLSSPFTFLLLLGMTGIRHTIWSFFVLLFFAFQFNLLQNEFRPVVQRSFLKEGINFILIVSLLALTILFFPQNKDLISRYLPNSKQSAYDDSAPFEFAKILSASVDKDPIFNDWEYGSFLILAQPHPIFIDTRNIIYDEKAFQDYLHVIEANSNWSEILDKYRIKYIILNKKIRQSLIQLIGQQSQWKILAENEFSIMYAR